MSGRGRTTRPARSSTGIPTFPARLLPARPPESSCGGTRRLQTGIVKQLTLGSDVAMNTNPYITRRPRQAGSLPLVAAISAASAITLTSAALAASLPGGLTLSTDATGVIATFNVAGAMDRDNP